MMIAKKIKKVFEAVVAFFASAICFIGYYPFVPAVCSIAGVSLGISKEKNNLFYIGMLLGIGYFMPIRTAFKYLFILLAMVAGIKLYIWANKRCSAAVSASIAGVCTAAMNLSAGLMGTLDRNDVILGVGEGLLVFSFSLSINLLYIFISSIDFEKTKEVAVNTILPDREEAFATAVGGLSKVIAKANNMIIEMPDPLSIMEQEVTGKLCAGCEGCAICWSGDRLSMSERIRNMVLDVKKRIDTAEIVKRGYVDCPHYEDMIKAATDAFLRMELNESWYRRLKENRTVISRQLDAMAELMKEWSKSENCIDSRRRMKLAKLNTWAREMGIELEKVHIYENVNEQIIIRMEVYSTWDGGIASTRLLKAAERAMGISFRFGKETKSLITEQVQSIVLYEDTKFYALSGIATRKKTGSMDSGDSLGIFELDNGEYNVCLSDGMGSGKRAKAESGLVVDLLEKFLEAGFKKDVAIRLMNSAMVLKGEENSFSTVDYAAINLYTGKVEIVKIGAAVSFLKREDTVEVVSGDSLPAGVDLEQELKTIENEMDNGDFLVMITDGVLEYLNVNDPKDKLCEIISDVSSDNSGVMAQEILDRVLLYTGGYAMDDMTVIVIGVWEK